MEKTTQGRRWVLPAVTIGVLLIAFGLRLRTEVPAIQPAVAQSPTSASPPIAAESSYSEAARQATPTAPISKVAPGVRHDYIVQASNMQLARSAVERAGGVVTGELGIIRAVGAALDARELASLWETPVAGLRVYDDAMVNSSDASASPDTYYPTQVAAHQLHQGGVMGRGVTVAVLDTGVWRDKGPLQRTSYGREPRVLAQYDVMLAREQPDAFIRA